MRTMRDITHAFIIRLWIEPSELNDTQPVWRGMIEHVEGKQRLYFDHLDKMRIYFANYLNELGFHTEDK